MKFEQVAADEWLNVGSNRYAAFRFEEKLSPLATDIMRDAPSVPAACMCRGR